MSMQEPGGDPELDRSFQFRIEEAVDRAGGAAELARKSGLSLRAINKYRCGASDPSRERLVAMARAAGVSVNWLAAGEGPMRAEEVAATPAAKPAESLDLDLLWHTVFDLQETLIDRRLSATPKQMADMVITNYTVRRTTRG